MLNLVNFISAGTVTHEQQIYGKNSCIRKKKNPKQTPPGDLEKSSNLHHESNYLVCSVHFRCKQFRAQQQLKLFSFL